MNERTSQGERPNVVFVFADQMRAMDMGCAGNDEVITPNFDRLNREGTRCSRTYANVPLCGPSRACIVTGQYPLTHTVIQNDLPLPTDAPSVGEAFGDAGYRTGYVGKWHLDGVPRSKFTPPGPRRQGFDDFWAVYNCSHDYENPMYYRDTPELIEAEGYEPAVQTDLAMEFVDEVQGSDASDDADDPTETDPFCLFLSWGPPHDPYELVPEEYRELYDPEELTMRPNAAPLLGRGANTSEPPIRHWGTSERFETGEPHDYDDPREVLADYYAAITALDDQLGRLLDHLDDRGLAEDTVVAFTADHGDMLYSQGATGKNEIYEESSNVPFLIRWPGEIPAGKENGALLSTVDFAPTLLGLAGIDAPPEMEGLDLSATVRGEAGPDDPSQKEVFIMSFGSPFRGLRTERYTYARVPEHLEEFAHVHGGRWLLFDNEADPYQLRNLVYDGEYADVVADLDRRLDEFLDEQGDGFHSMEDHARDLGLVEEWNDKSEWFCATHEGYGEPSYLDSNSSD